MPNERVLCMVIRGNNFAEAFLADFSGGIWRLIDLPRNWSILPNALDFVPVHDVTHWRYFNDDNAPYTEYAEF